MTRTLALILTILISQSLKADFAYRIFAIPNIINKETKEFRGRFPGSLVMVRINITIENELITGFIEFQGDEYPTKLKGTIKNRQFEVAEVDELDEPTGNSILGKIERNIMLASYFKNGNIIDFEFAEIDINNPPPFNETIEKKQFFFSPEFQRFIDNFNTLSLPTPIEYDSTTSRVTNIHWFMDKPIQRIGSSDRPIVLNDRLQILKKLYKGGKVIFPDGQTGIIIHAYFNSPLDGEQYASYFFIYDTHENFSNAFVVYEANIKDSPIITTKLSRSYIFVISDLNEQHSFTITRGGNISFRIH